MYERISKGVVIHGVIAALFLVVGFGIGAFAVTHNPSVFAQVNTGAPLDADLTSFWKLWNELDARFVPATVDASTTPESRIHGAMQGLAQSYGDPYTVYLPPVENAQFSENLSGNFQGVGMEIAVKEGVLTVVSPLKDSPAYKAGVLAGDLILKIDGVSTDGVPSEEAVKKIRGPQGTTVKLTLYRDKKIIDISVVRDVINLPTIDTQLKDGVFVIALYTFNEQSPNLFRDALREFAASGSSKLVLDLRGNPGGYLEAAVDMASFFLPVGKVVVTEDFGEGKTKRAHRSYGYNAFPSISMTVLIDGGSASASEILAGALNQQGVANLIGSQSFGKGSVQELVPITKDSSLKVTIAHWLTPNGSSISQKGLTPDTEVIDSNPADDVDEVLNKAIELLNKAQ